MHLFDEETCYLCSQLSVLQLSLQHYSPSSGRQYFYRLVHPVPLRFTPVLRTGCNQPSRAGMSLGGDFRPALVWAGSTPLTRPGKSPISHYHLCHSPSTYCKSPGKASHCMKTSHQVGGGKESMHESTELCSPHSKSPSLFPLSTEKYMKIK